MTNTTAAAATAAPAGNPCLCSTFEIVTREFELENGQPDYEAETTGCTSWTAREFAPGHDAKLKALLIRAGINGWDVRRNLGGMVAISDAQKAASDFAFAYMVDQGITRGRAKAAAKADRNAAKAERPKTGRVARKVGKPAVAPAASTREHIVAAIAATETVEIPAEAPATTQIKVGRWEYAATIDAAGDAHYTSGKGAAAVAVKGTYKLV